MVSCRVDLEREQTRVVEAMSSSSRGSNITMLPHNNGRPLAFSKLLFELENSMPNRD